MQPMSIIWLIAITLFTIGEALTVGLTSIWFAAGALGALIVSQLGGALWMQITAFLVLSAATLLLARPLARRYLKPGYSATNADRIIGAEAIVTQEIDNLRGVGQANVAGQIWTARSEEDVVLNVGTKVTVTRIEGVKVFVKGKTEE